MATIRSVYPPHSRQKPVHYLGDYADVSVSCTVCGKTMAAKEGAHHVCDFMKPIHGAGVVVSAGLGIIGWLLIAAVAVGVMMIGGLADIGPQ